MCHIDRYNDGSGLQTMLWKVKHGGWIVLFTPLPEVPQYSHLSILGRTVFRSEVGAKHNPPCHNNLVDRVIIHDADKGLQRLGDGRFIYASHSQLHWGVILRLQERPTSLVHC